MACVDKRRVLRWHVLISFFLYDLEFIILTKILKYYVPTKSGRTFQNFIVINLKAPTAQFVLILPIIRHIDCDIWESFFNNDIQLLIIVSILLSIL